ncbi:MAG: methionyl-tRNA formyltransferase [Mycobacteriaceae bacterium]
MRLVFAGTPDAAVPSLRALLEHPRHDVVGVLTRPDAPAGRGKKPSRSPVGRLADDAGVPVLTPHRVSEAVDELRALSPDCLPVVAYGALVPATALDLAPHGWVNLHFSLLPAWRGAAPVQAAVRSGDEVTGASTFRIEAGLDTGPVFGVLTETVRATDTAGSLLERLSVAGAELLVATMDGLADGGLHAVPQPAEGVSVAPKISVDDARVDWASPALAVDRLVRAVTPEPGAWTELGPLRVKLGPVTRTEVLGLAPGQLEVGKSAVLVGTATEAVRLGTVQPPGRRPMAAADWARGARLEPSVVAR